MSEPTSGHANYRVIVRAILLTAWDPIGVSDLAEAQDEYDSYVTALCTLVGQRATADQIFEHLWQIETDHMGLTGDSPNTRAASERLAALGRTG